MVAYLVLGELEIGIVSQLGRVTAAAVDDILGGDTAEHDVAVVTIVFLFK
jgi:hypothetical protein